MGLSINLESKSGQISLNDVSTGVAILPNLQIVAEFSDGSSVTTAGEQNIIQNKKENQIHWPGSKKRAGITLELNEAKHNSVILQLKIHNTTNSSIKLDTLSPMVCDEINLGTSHKHLLFYRTGWQSWSPTGTVMLQKDELPSGPPVVSPIIQPPHDSELNSPWAAAIRGKSSATLFIGFLTAINQLCTIRLAKNGSVWASCHLEGILLEKGATETSELLYLNFGNDEVDLLKNYANETAKNMGARRNKPIVTGWCSWYQFFSQVHEKDILQTVKYLKELKQKNEIQVVQLDDGYEAEFGDWLMVNEKFPKGLSWLVKQIKRAGFTPGLWMAPFAVSPDSTLFEQHPDWIVRGEDGEPLQTWSGFDWDQQLYGLDCTHPEVQVWLRNTFETVVYKWGFEYLKLDFLCCGALRGLRFDRSTTSVQAYRKGIKLIREIVGDRYLLGCGAPLLPSVGLIDGMRIGCDIAHFWDSDEKDKFKVWPSASNAIRNTIGRYWMHTRFWQNDPDCLIMRDTDNQLTEVEVQTWAALVGLSGGQIILSDSISDLGEKQLRLINSLLPSYGESAIPLNLFLPELSRVLLLKIEKSFEMWYVVGLFNWQNEETKTSIELKDLFGAGEWHTYDFWNKKYLGTVREKLTLKLQSHGCRLLALRRVVQRPQLVGSTFHFTQGGVEIVNQIWDNSKLKVNLHNSTEKQGELVFAWPNEYVLDSIESDLTSPNKRIKNNLVSIDCFFKGDAKLEMNFSLNR